MPAGHGTTDVAAPATGLYTPGELDVTGAGAGGTFSDFLALICTPMITLGKSILTRLSALEAKIILQRTTNQVIATATVTPVTYSGADLINTGFGGVYLNITRGTGLMVCSVAGTYKVQATIDFAANATGVREVFIDTALAATPTVFTAQTMLQLPASASGINNLPAQAFITLAIGDVLRISVAQSSGGNLNVVAAHVELHKIV